MLQHGLSIRWCIMAGCKEHWQNWKWDVCVYVCWGCEIVQTCVWIIAQQLCAMQQINVALCQATANISASLVCVSLTVFFSSSPSSCSFCLALLMLCIHITVQHENANYIFKNPCYIIAYLVVENWFLNVQIYRERGKNCQDSRKEINSSHCKKAVES